MHLVPREGPVFGLQLVVHELLKVCEVDDRETLGLQKCRVLEIPEEQVNAEKLGRPLGVDVRFGQTENEQYTQDSKYSRQNVRCFFEREIRIQPDVCHGAESHKEDHCHKSRLLQQPALRGVRLWEVEDDAAAQTNEPDLGPVAVLDLAPHNGQDEDPQQERDPLFFHLWNKWHGRREQQETKNRDLEPLEQALLIAFLLDRVQLWVVLQELLQASFCHGDRRELASKHLVEARL
mmetsp:Transcript_21950/g.61357  ORF Transcript_21950/g.61357 Transcript_21950/m.61357 type:complete len:235 (+) Transcript_21950:438-1142(+)|eukprot:CAMPEP_0117556366 /NCGR_PEP_ID=MMETSP0784-20121206/51771_1 /TAXON_ID=39447 /ORGANISM="" /LENGTH=234 /DNA_ID=CAMNT_0005353637 /DNA_START=349 /DNA_END=1053 /DNA_ORIENTATION=+